MDCRKRVRDLTEDERRDFVTAVRKLKDSGEYDRFVKTHFETAYEQQSGSWRSKGQGPRNDAHGGPAFLPWHRKYIREFEKKLQEQVPGVTLPYWDWTEDAEKSGSFGQPEEIPVLSGDPNDPTDGLLGGITELSIDDDQDASNHSVGPVEDGLDPSDSYDWWIKYRHERTPLGEVSLVEYDSSDEERLRRSLDPVDDLPDAETVEAALQIENFYEEGFDWGTQSFRNVLEGWQPPPAENFDSPSDQPSSSAYLHNQGHVWIGGDMGPMTSPNDPIFFLHHCFIDKLWADWQARHPDAEQFPPTNSNAPDGHKLGTQMPPWNIDPGTTIDYRSMGYVYDESPPRVELTRPAGSPTTLAFNDVPEGRETSRAAVFEVVGCETSVTLEVEDVTAPFSVKPGMKTRTHSTDAETAQTEANVWLTYTGQSPGTNASGSATIYCPETDERWTVQLTANTISEPTAGVAVVLDESGSMASASGDGNRTRVQVLRDAAEVFLDLLPAGNSLGIATFHSDASPALSMRQLGGQGSSARSDARTTIRALSPTEPDPATDAGYTSIGDGVTTGRSLLSAASDVDERAMVVFTDGHENRPEYIADLEPSGTDDQTFAVGLGTPSQVRPNALQRLTNAGGPDEGYVLVSGQFSDDDRFLLDKYFLQVLAGITNREVVVDPQGRLRPESETSAGVLSMPFDVSSADLGVDVVVLSPGEHVFDVAVETPDGVVLEPGDMTGSGGQFVDGERVDAFRLQLPYDTGEGQARAGEWTVHLRINEKGFDRYLGQLEETNIDEYERTIASGVPYNLSVNARSNLSLDASVQQSSFEPGSSLALTAALDESGLPLSDATVTADHVRPDGTRQTVRLARTEPGTFAANVDDAAEGRHAFRVQVEGTTLSGDPFTRESLATGSVWTGGDDPLPSRKGTGGGDTLSELLPCLIRNDALEEYFHENGIDPEIVRECLERTGGN